MKTWYLFAAMGGVFGLLALAGSSAKADSTSTDTDSKSTDTGPPLPEGSNWRWELKEFPQGTIVVPVGPFGIVMTERPTIVNQFFGTFSGVTYVGDSDKIGGGFKTTAADEAKAWTELDKALAMATRFRNELQAGFKNNRRSLPADANPARIDKYTNHLVSLPYWAGGASNSKSVSVYQLQRSSYRRFDEYGRTVPSEDGEGSSGILGDFLVSLGNLASNPAFRIAATVVAGAFGGPAGVAAYTAFDAYVVRGETVTAESFALTAARGYVVSQCGPACGAAFDFGVGVASGQSVDEAAETALLNQMSPSERAAYEEGRKVYEEFG